MSILDLLQHIVNEPAPQLEGRRRSFPVEAQEFVRACLIKSPAERGSPQDLLVSAPWSNWAIKNRGGSRRDSVVGLQRRVL